MHLTDKRTIAGIASGGTATYPHGLGKVPDTVVVRWNQTLATAAAVASIVPLIDASNVTLQNIGSVLSPNMEVSTIVFHSLIV